MDYDSAQCNERLKKVTSQFLQALTVAIGDKGTIQELKIEAEFINSIKFTPVIDWSE